MYSFHTSRKLRLVQCSCAIFWSVLAAGPIFGFAALKPILILEKIYEKECDISTNTSSIVNIFALDPNMFGSLSLHFLPEDRENNPVVKCSAQDLKLNFMFTVGAVVTNTSAIVIGRILDKYGPKFCGFIGAGLLSFACVVFIFASLIEKSFIDPYLLGYAAMALGGPFSFISSFHLSNTFPNKSGTILAFFNGAFDASSVVFLLYKLYYMHFDSKFSLDKFFKLYLIVPVFIALSQIFFMPKSSYLAPPDTSLLTRDSQSSLQNEAESSERDPLLSSTTIQPNPLRRRDSIGDALKQHYVYESDENISDHRGGLFGILHGYSSEYQIKTTWFYHLCAFTSIQMLRLNYFIATINSQYTYLLGSPGKSEPLIRIFTLALPLGGLISVPFVGYVLDTYSTLSIFGALLVLSLIVGIAGLVGNAIFGLVNICLFVVFRPYFYTAISDICAKIFGFDTFGAVYGAVICIAGLFNLLQSTLDNITHSTFDMNPTPINAILICLTVVIGGFAYNYMRQQTILYREKLNRSVPSTI